MERQVSILDGGTFVVSDVRGNIQHSVNQPLGLFHLDTRFLSEWILTIDGIVPAALSTDDVQYFQARFFLVPRPAAMYVESTLSVIRTRYVGDGFHEDLLLMNHGKVRCARLAREFWRDPGLAARLEREAAELKRRFNQDFWIEERGFFALALDGSKRKVDSLTSNIGHLLWSGIVEDSLAERVAEHLLGPHLFSGWGVRTMADDEGGYNPIGYHVGTIWPHDNSLIALGLRRYGFRVEAGKVAMGNLAAARFFHYRLPEAFAGYPRELTGFPVEYPTACSPQAWATGAPMLFLRTLLGLEPVGNALLVDPAIPAELGELQLLDIPGRWGKSDAFGRARRGPGPLRAA